MWGYRRRAAGRTRRAARRCRAAALAGRLSAAPAGAVPDGGPVAVLETASAAGVLDARFADGLRTLHGGYGNNDAYRAFLAASRSAPGSASSTCWCRRSPSGPPTPCAVR
ncbi:hypothetical protein ACFQ3Z_02985 [Streptomyces nogalater]